MSGADENIAIDVDDSAIDAAIAKLDEALRKTAEVVGETPEVANRNRLELIASSFLLSPTAKWIPKLLP